MHSVRHWVSFGVGVIIFLLGLFPLIGKESWIPFSETIFGVVAAYLVAFGGLYIIVDSFFEFTFHSGVGITTLIVGLLVCALGVLTVLDSMGMVAIGLSTWLKPLIYQVLFILEGLFLMIAAFIMD